MPSFATVLSVTAGLLFHTFLGGYWYLVHALQPDLAVVAAAGSWALFAFLRSRLSLRLPTVVLLVASGLLYFLMLNPPPSFRGVGLMLWALSTTLLFRLAFAQLSGAGLKIGALVASYVLFLALPMGLPRIGGSLPSIEPDRPLDVAIVGAGFGGMAIGKELLDSGITNFQIFEAASEVGGTWWHNRYPGLHVDVPSALYSYSFYPNPNWSRRWAPRDELLAYSQSASEALGVRPFIQFETWVKGARFDEATGLWVLELSGRTVHARHVVLATGGLHIPKTPVFDGADDYRGTSFHSARWRDDVELAGQRIAIIGSGASAVQIIPEIAKEAAQVDMYQRTPNWVSPQDNREISALRQWSYAYVPMAYKLQRLRTHLGSEFGFRAVFPLESTQRAGVEQALTGYIRETVKDESLVPSLIPDYEFGCKRPLVTGRYYPSLNRDNVSVITEGIERMTPDGIRSVEGVERPYDVIIMATGYRVAELPFPIAGREGSELAELWQHKPEAYESMMVSGFPNLYLMSGPNSGVFGSIIIHIESAANYMIQVIEKAGDEWLVEPRPDAQQAYTAALQADLQQTVWAGSCKSWYKLPDGYVVANNPHPISRIVLDRSRPRWEDLVLQRRD